MRYKEHCVEAEILGDKQESCTWKNCDSYEQDLIHLGWTLAHEGESAIPPPEANLMTLSAFNDALQHRSHQLTTQLEAVCQLNKELTKELECECLNVSLRASEADFWQDQLQHLQEKYRELEDRLLESQPCVQPSKNINMMSEDSHPVEILTQPRVQPSENIDMMSEDGHPVEILTQPCVQPSENIDMTSEDGHPVEILTQIAPTDGIQASLGPLNHLLGMLLPGNESRPELFDLAIIEHVAVAHDDTSTSHECEF
jgi:hypothetical protein